MQSHDDGPGSRPTKCILRSARKSETARRLSPAAPRRCQPAWAVLRTRYHCKQQSRRSIARVSLHFAQVHAGRRPCREERTARPADRKGANLVQRSGHAGSGVQSGAQVVTGQMYLCRLDCARRCACFGARVPAPSVKRRSQGFVFVVSPSSHSRNLPRPPHSPMSRLVLAQRHGRALRPAFPVCS